MKHKKDECIKEVVNGLVEKDAFIDSCAYVLKQLS